LQEGILLTSSIRFIIDSMVKRLLGLIVLVAIIASGGFYLYLSKTYPNLSPLLTSRYYFESLMHPHVKLDKHVMGFLPYWRLDDTQYIKPELLSEINYFSLDVDSDGKIKTIVNGETDPGYNGWQTQAVKKMAAKAHITGTDFTVTIAALNNGVIESVLTSPTAQTTLTSQIVDLVKTNNLNGITIDFEYSGIPDAQYRQKFTTFSKELVTKLKNDTPTAKISLSVMPLAARNDDLFDFAKLAPIYDRFIGMSYDFYGEHSDIAGPIAPMRGFKDNKYFFDVETMYEDLTKNIPKEKIIMGIPYYGWDWAVTDGKKINSSTLSSDDPDSYAAVISYARAKEDKNLKSKQCTWDEYALETWCWYTDKNNIDHQVWLADGKTIQTRFDYANKQKFGGIGIWVLGYDKDYPDLWEMIGKKFIK
jgi:spore germination protein